MGNYSSALTADIEDFDAIVSVTETLNELAAHVEDERFQSQILSLVSIFLNTDIGYGYYCRVVQHVIGLLSL